MRKTIFCFMFITFMGSALAADIHLAPLGPFNSPIGIDFQESGQGDRVSDSPNPGQGVILSNR